MNPIARFAKRFLTLVFAASLSSCGLFGDDDDKPAQPTNEVGSAGGTVTLDGVTIAVPAGALSNTIRVSVQSVGTPSTPPTEGTPIGTEFEIGPADATFAAPVTVTVPFDASLLQSGQEPVLHRHANGTWSELPSQSIAGGTVSATTTGLSRFAPFGFRRQPFFVRQPQDASVTEPAAATFDAIVGGMQPLQFQWERRRPGDAAFSAITSAMEPSARTRSFTTQATTATPSASPPDTEAAHGTQYRLVVTNPRGSATSAVATLSVAPQPKATLMVKVEGSGSVQSDPAGILCGSACSHDFPLNQEVKLAATPAPGNLLSGFAGGGVDNPNDCADRIVVMSAARTCTVTFVAAPPQTAALTVSVSGSGTVTSDPAGIGCSNAAGSDCSEAYPIGAPVDLTAVAASGYVFTAWSGHAECAGSSPTVRLTMAADRRCTATFQAPPAIASGPLSRTVVEGSTATFAVSATGSAPLGYLWGSSGNGGSSWSAIVACGSSPSCSIGPANPTSAASGGHNGLLVRVTVGNGAGSVTSAAATMTVVPLSQGAQVYVQYPGGGSIFSNSLATVTGAGYSATADLSAGEFVANVAGTPFGLSVNAGTANLVFYNNTGGPVTIAAGDVRATFQGTYAHPAPGTLSSQFGSKGVLTAFHNNLQYAARADHDLGINSNGTSANQLTPFTTNGGVVVVNAASLTAVDVELSLPALTLDPGASIVVGFVLTVTAVNGTANFTATPARISLKLPAGVMLDSNASVPLRWVTN
jgi:hypothetical protein